MLISICTSKFCFTLFNIDNRLVPWELFSGNQGLYNRIIQWRTVWSL